MEGELLNLLLLPLLGGYVFFSRLHWTSLAAKRIEGQRLIYSSSVVAVFLILGARTVEITVAALDRDPQLNSLLLSMFLSLTLIAQAMVGITLGAAAFTGRLDQSRDPSYLPRAAKICSVLLLGLLLLQLFLLYPLYLEPRLWHAPAGGAIGLILLLLVRNVANWVRKTSRQTVVTAVVRVALLVLALSCGTVLILARGSNIAQWWGTEFSSIKYSGIALLAAAIGMLGWMPINVILTDRWAWRHAHRRGQTSGLELLLYRAWALKSAVQLTLKDGKVYIGYIAEMPAPKPNPDGSCIELIPMSSGYRTANKTVRITTDYAGVISKIRAEAEAQEEEVKATLRPALALLSKVIPISEVSVAALYSDRYMAKNFAVRKKSRTAEAVAPAQPSVTN